MKRTPKVTVGPEMRPEYRFDYRHARSNRFAARMTMAVVLDSDVAEVFRSSDSVNAVLRSVIAAFPKQRYTQEKRKIRRQ